MAADKLSAYDLHICHAFSYKVQTHTTDSDFQKLPYVFPSDQPLPKINSIRSRVAFLSGFKPEFYDCCPKSCCCYVGPHENLSECPYCNEPQFSVDGKPQKKFTYIPIIPRLIVFAGNKSMAKQMQYQAYEHSHTTGVSTDVFDGHNYCSLRQQQVAGHLIRNIFWIAKMLPLAFPLMDLHHLIGAN